VLGAEIADKTVYGVLCKPVDRVQFIVGKFAGLFVTLALNFLLIALIFVAAITIMTGRAPQAEIFCAVLLLLVEMSVIIAAAIAWSCFTTPTLAAIFTLSFYAAGHLNDLITLSADAQSNPFLKAVLSALHYILPNLEYFNIRTAVVFGLNIAQGHIFFATIYGLLYTGLLLLISSVLFDRKDL